VKAERDLGPDCRLVLRALREAPRRTLTNVQLAELKGGAFAWRTRVSDLRAAGWPVSDAERVHGRKGVYAYTLGPETETADSPTLFEVGRA
jgi:hypothetical protein